VGTLPLYWDRESDILTRGEQSKKGEDQDKKQVQKGSGGEASLRGQLAPETTAGGRGPVLELSWASAISPPATGEKHTIARGGYNMKPARKTRDPFLARRRKSSREGGDGLEGGDTNIAFWGARGR